MRILHVVESLASRYGGPSVACPALCRELARRGHQVAIYTTNVDGDHLLDVPLGQPVVNEGVEVCYFPAWVHPREYKLSLPLWRALRDKIRTFHVAHIYSLYGFTTFAAAHFCRKYAVPYLLHPHGSLDPFLRRRHRFRKWLYTMLFLNRGFRHAAAVEFNSAEEMRLAMGWSGLNLPSANGRPSPKKVVVYVGVEDAWFKAPDPAAQERFRSRFPQFAGRRLIVFFGRINFKKGLDILAQAFALVARERNDVHLALAGPDNEGYGQKVRGWLKEGGVLEKATFTGLLSGDDRFAVMHEAELFVLPSYTENFGAAVAEAMACAVPVVISDRVNIWPEVREAGAGMVVPCDAHETAQALLTLLKNPSLGKEMGQRGRRLAEQKMTWKVVTDQMIQVYQQLARGSVAVPQTLDPEMTQGSDTSRTHLHSLCKLCETGNLKPLYRSRKHAFHVCRCASCGFIFVREKASEQQLRQMYSEDQGFREFANAINSEKVRTGHRRALKEIKNILNVIPNNDGRRPKPTLLDVGCGAGVFLKAAKDEGFDVHGNEFSKPAIRMARELYNIELSSTAIEDDERTGYFDVITMWGLIEHVSDPRGLLENAFRLLKTGGLLYVYTPVWCSYDEIALLLNGASKARWTRLLDRRITPAHLQLFSQPVLERAIARARFDLLSVERVCEYNLHVAAYLESLGVPSRIHGGLAWALDKLIDRKIFFRNNMRLFCQKRDRDAYKTGEA